MKTTTLAIAAAMAAGTLVRAQEAVQWRVEDGGNGHWYQVRSDANSTWQEWQLVAVNRSGYLATLTTIAEFAFVDALVLSTPSPNIQCAIGAYQDHTAPDYSEPAGGWRWVTNEPFEPLLWCPPGPSNSGGNEDYMSLGREGNAPGCWNDYGGWPSRAVLEFSADCNGDGIVDYGQILGGTFADVNENGVPDCCEDGTDCQCLGDVNNDGQVNGADISVLLGFWGLNGKPVAADINRDGVVNGADLAQLLGSWGPCK